MAATLWLLCARCGFELTVSSHGPVLGHGCPRCGDRAVDITDLAPERAMSGFERFARRDLAELERDVAFSFHRAYLLGPGDNLADVIAHGQPLDLAWARRAAS